MTDEVTGVIFNTQRFSIQDGPGIRTTIFPKGCPLRCPWCSNPESQNAFLEMSHVDSLCDHCGRCIDHCKVGAISLAEKGIKIDREKCNNCGDCIKVCAQDALKMFGEEVSVEEVLDEISKDSLYYASSNGGATCGGGEPLNQARFVSELFRRCHESGIHTTLDTCGYGSRSDLERVLDHTDLVFHDLKAIDPDYHMAITKASNAPILRNIKRVLERDIPTVIRIPLIPGLVDTDKNLEDIAEFVQKLNHKLPVNVLPYHRFGLSKYKMLDREYELMDLESQNDDRLKKVVQIFKSKNLDCEVVR